MTDGERWARSELDALRAAGFRGAAWSRFLASSRRRAAAGRKARPALTRQARTWSTTGLAAGLLARHAATRLGLTAPSRRAWLAWWLATSAMLDWHLGMLEGEDGEPHDRLRSADALTLTRLALVPFIAAARPTDRRSYSALIAGGAATDVLDGALARRTGTTRLGRDLDTVADALTGAAAARSAQRAGWLTPATARLATAREVIPIAVVAATYFRTGVPPRGTFGDTRQAAPALAGGLALAPLAPRLGDLLVRASALLALTTALTRRFNRVTGSGSSATRTSALRPAIGIEPPLRGGLPEPRDEAPDHPAQRRRELQAGVLEQRFRLV